MRIALVASPFISVPPSHYGGTELFIAQLAEGLQRKGFDVVVYANGESTVGTDVRSLYPTGEWPIKGELYANLKDIDHSAWAVHDAWKTADIIHLNNLPGLVFSRFAGPQFVYTIHHPHKRELSEFYAHYPDVEYVSISKFQQQKESMPRIRTIHHGVDTSLYRVQEKKQSYLCFLGRVAPMKGTHTAIEVAKRCGIPLKIAGEVQPIYRDYFEAQVKPHVDGKFIEYIGEADLDVKNELLGNSLAMLFPIEWDEPFGLVMIEAMATGTPVLAFPRGAAPEVTKDGISGYLCKSADEMVERLRELPGRFSPAALRAYIEKKFSVERMVSDYVNLYAECAPPDREFPEGVALLPPRMTTVPVEAADDPEDSQAIA